VLIHGRFDLGGPVDSACQPAEVWADAELEVVDTGHSGGADMTACIAEATNRFATVG
jgi:proline iminopeptidase